jgi:Ca2+-binding RTX toxin-like protein
MDGAGEDGHFGSRQQLEANMATIDYFAGNGAFAAPTTTFDITSVVAKRVGTYLNYYSFDTDGTMFVLHVLGTEIVGWDHIDGATTLQTGVTNLAVQPFLDNMNSRNPSSTRAMAYFLSTDDVLNGSRARDTMASGGGSDTLNGNGGNDNLMGGAGQDRLIGGAGADRLTGGADADHFVFNLPGEGSDKITDFVPGLDQIDLAGSTFGLSGPLVDGVSFISGGPATSAAATVLYDPVTGILGFDADGTGAGAAVVLATLTNHAALSASDILVF